MNVRPLTLQQSATLQPNVKGMQMQNHLFSQTDSCGIIFDRIHYRVRKELRSTVEGLVKCLFFAANYFSDL